MGGWPGDGGGWGLHSVGVWRGGESSSLVYRKWIRYGLCVCVCVCVFVCVCVI